MLKVKIVTAVMLFLLIFNLKAREQGKIQLSVAAPSPVKAGQKITFMQHIINNGNVTWNPGEYSIYVDIYDKDKKYVRKTDEIVGEVAVAPGDPTVLTLDYDVPKDFIGVYFCRANLKVKGNVVDTGDFVSFRVVPFISIKSTVEKVPVPETELNGSLSILYRNQITDGYWSYSILGNLIGQAKGSSLSMSADLDLDSVNDFERNNFLLSYRGNRANIFAGDIAPDYSEFSLSNMTLFGANVEPNIGIFKFSFIGAQSQEAVEASSTTAGAFARYLYCGKVTTDLLGSKLSFSYLRGSDDENSISATGIFTTPAENEVFCVGSSVEWLYGFNLGGEFARGKYDSDITDNVSSVEDTSFKIYSKNRVGAFRLDGEYRKVGKDFVSMGNPGLVKDREGFNLLSDYTFNILNLSAGYSDYNDNVSDENKVTTTEKNINGALTLNFPEIFTFAGNYNISSLVNDGSPSPSVDNYTESYSLSLTFYLKKSGETSIYSSMQPSKFVDRTGQSSDVKTMNITYGINTAVGKKFSINAGKNRTENREIGSGLLTKSDSFSFSLNYQVIKDRLTVSVWSSFTDRTDNQNTTDIDEINGTMEVSISLKNALMLILGYETVRVNDKLDRANNKQQSIMSSRLAYNF